MHTQSLQLCPILCDPMDYSLSGFSVHGIPQARILEWVAMPSSRGSSRLKDQTCVSCLLHWQEGSLSLATPGKPKTQVQKIFYDDHSPFMPSHVYLYLSHCCYLLSACLSPLLVCKFSKQWNGCGWCVTVFEALINVIYSFITHFLVLFFNPYASRNSQSYEMIHFFPSYSKSSFLIQ